MNEQQPTPISNIASRSKRFLAALIDGLASLLVVFPMLTDPKFLEAVKNQASLPPDVDFRLPLLGLLVLIGVHAYLLHKYGQTIGKRIVGIAIVTLDNRKPNFWFLIIFRYVPRWVLGSLPSIGPILTLADVLFIFSNDDNRCVHDLIAKTKVIDLSIKTTELPDQNSFIA